jgi:hypothetical protein
MDIRSKIWYDFVNTKYGDEYLILYLAKQRRIRKRFKIATIVFSASGIFGWKVWELMPVFACGGIAIIQLITSLENFLVHSEKDLDDLSRLRLMYYERANKLEHLWHLYYNSKITDDEAGKQFFGFRTSAKAIEDLDNKLNVRQYPKLIKESDKRANHYLKTYYHE